MKIYNIKSYLNKTNYKLYNGVNHTFLEDYFKRNPAKYKL